MKHNTRMAITFLLLVSMMMMCIIAMAYTVIMIVANQLFGNLSNLFAFILFILTFGCFFVFPIFKKKEKESEK